MAGYQATETVMGWAEAFAAKIAGDNKVLQKIFASFGIKGASSPPRALPAPPAPPPPARRKMTDDAVTPRTLTELAPRCVEPPKRSICSSAPPTRHSTAAWSVRGVGAVG